MDGQLWVEPIGDLIIARVRGQPSEALGDIHLRRAIVVPNTRLAYLARLAFGEGDTAPVHDPYDSTTF